MDARVGDQLEFMISYENISGETQSNVTVKNILPDGLRYIENTAKLYSENHPNGMIITDTAINANDINIGDYATGSNAYIIFIAEVTDKAFADGSDTLVNWTRVSVCSTAQQHYVAISHKKAELFIVIEVILAGLIVICSIVSIRLHHKLKRLEDGS